MAIKQELISYTEQISEFRRNHIPRNDGRFLNCVEKSSLLNTFLKAHNIKNVLVFFNSPHTAIYLLEERIFIDPYVGFLYENFNLKADKVRIPDIKFTYYREWAFNQYYLLENLVNWDYVHLYEDSILKNESDKTT